MTEKEFVTPDLLKITEYKLLEKLPDPFVRDDGQRLADMEKAMASLGIRDATERIYETILGLIQ